MALYSSMLRLSDISEKIGMFFLEIFHLYYKYIDLKAALLSFKIDWTLNTKGRMLDIFCKGSSPLISSSLHVAWIMQYVYSSNHFYFANCFDVIAISLCEIMDNGCSRYSRKRKKSRRGRRWNQLKKCRQSISIKETWIYGSCSSYL